MMLSALASGERPHALKWFGLFLALGGLIYMLIPGVNAPSPAGGALMTVAGIAWGRYSILGRGSDEPVAESAGNFVRALPLVLAASLLSTSIWEPVTLTQRGVFLAIVSGAFASGVGYAIWYAALRGLSSSVASLVQLTVPVIAAIGGIVFLSEPITRRLLIASVIILGGVTLAVRSKGAPSGARMSVQAAKGQKEQGQSS